MAFNKENYVPTRGKTQLGTPNWATRHVKLANEARYDGSRGTPN